MPTGPVPGARLGLGGPPHRQGWVCHFQTPPSGDLLLGAPRRPRALAWPVAVSKDVRQRGQRAGLSLVFLALAWPRSAGKLLSRFPSGPAFSPPQGPCCSCTLFICSPFQTVAILQLQT